MQGSEDADNASRQADGADARVQPWQAALKPGDFCVVLHGGGVNYVEILEPPDDGSPRSPLISAGPAVIARWASLVNWECFMCRR